MKIIFGILVVLLVLATIGIISYLKMTSFVDEIDIREPENGEDRDITQPSKSEIKNYLFFAEIFMKPAYKNIIFAGRSQRHGIYIVCGIVLEGDSLSL